MIKLMVTVRDTLTGYAEPSCFKDEEVAKREFKNAFINHPNKDYMQLWKVGTFDNESGTVIPLPAPELIDKGVNYEQGNSNREA